MKTFGKPKYIGISAVSFSPQIKDHEFTNRERITNEIYKTIKSNLDFIVHGIKNRFDKHKFDKHKFRSMIKDYVKNSGSYNDMKKMINDYGIGIIIDKLLTCFGIWRKCFMSTDDEKKNTIIVINSNDNVGITNHSITLNGGQITLNGGHDMHIRADAPKEIEFDEKVFKGMIESYTNDGGSLDDLIKLVNDCALEMILNKLSKKHFNIETRASSIAVAVCDRCDQHKK